MATSSAGASPASARSGPGNARTEDEARELEARLAEATAQRVLSRTPGIPGWDDSSTRIDAADPAYALETYLTAIVKGNRELRETTREVALRNIRVHIAGTAIGRVDVRTMTPEALTAYWAGLGVGRGALGNIAQLLRLAFRRVQRDGLRDDNPSNGPTSGSRRLTVGGTSGR